MKKQTVVLLLESVECLYWKVFRELNDGKHRLIFRSGKQEISKLFKRRIIIDCVLINLEENFLKSGMPEELHALSGETPVLAIADEDIYNAYAEQYNVSGRIDRNAEGHKLAAFIEDALLDAGQRESSDKARDKVSSIQRYLGKNDTTEEVVSSINDLKDEICPVLIIGERGTEKEVVARYIHHYGERNIKPFLTIDVRSIPGNTLVYTSIFGGTQEKGIIELANGGTLFLKHLSYMPLTAQKQLASFIKNGSFTGYRDKKQIFSDVRIIASVGECFSDEAESGKVYQELYEMFEELTLSPIRTERKNIKSLIKKYLDDIALKTKKKIGISTEAIDYISSREWRGNNEELNELITKVVLYKTSDSDIEYGKSAHKYDICVELEDIIEYIDCYDVLKVLQGDVTLAEASAKAAGIAEKEVISLVLRKNNGNKLKTSQILQIDYSTLHRKIKNYGIIKK